MRTAPTNIQFCLRAAFHAPPPPRGSSLRSREGEGAGRWTGGLEHSRSIVIWSPLEESPVYDLGLDQLNPSFSRLHNNLLNIRFQQHVHLSTDVYFTLLGVWTFQVLHHHLDLLRIQLVLLVLLLCFHCLFAQYLHVWLFCTVEQRCLRNVTQNCLWIHWKLSKILPSVNSST